MFNSLKLRAILILTILGFTSLGLYVSYYFGSELTQINTAKNGLDAIEAAFSRYDSLFNTLGSQKQNLSKIAKTMGTPSSSLPSIGSKNYPAQAARSDSVKFFNALNRIYFSNVELINRPRLPAVTVKGFLNSRLLNNLMFDEIFLCRQKRFNPNSIQKSRFPYPFALKQKTLQLSSLQNSKAWQQLNTALNTPLNRWSAPFARMIYSLTKKLFQKNLANTQTQLLNFRNHLILFILLPFVTIELLLAFAFLFLLQKIFRSNDFSQNRNLKELTRKNKPDIFDFLRTKKSLLNKAHENLMVRSKRLFAELWDKSPDGMLLINFQSEILAVNEAYCSLVRQKREDLIGKPFTIVYDNSERAELQEQFELCLSGKNFAHSHEAEYKMWFGQKLWLEFSHSSLQLANIGPAVLSIVKDITLRKKTLLELADSEKRFRMLFNNANDAAFVTPLTDDNRFGRFIEINKSACETYLYSREEFLHLNPLILIPSEYRQKERNAIETLLKTGQVIYEVEHFRKDKRRIPVEISAHLFEYKSRATVLSIVRDISERKRAQKALQLSREQLRNLASRLHDIREEERSMIAREIHDELGQQLTVLKIEISLLCNRFKQNSPDIQQKVGTISELINQAVESVQQISSKLRPGILDEVGLVAALEWQAQEFSKHTDIQCHYSLTEEINELDRDKSTALFRIFQEALTNVARHARARRVSIFLKKTANHVILEITDNGCGIKRQQIESPRSLGILGMRERALVFGGNVSIRGVPGKGTYVKVEMPLG